MPRKKTVTKKKVATKKKTATQKPAVAKPAETSSDNSSPEGTTPDDLPQVDESPEGEEGSVVRGEDVVVLELPDHADKSFNTLDELRGEVVTMRLTKGNNRVPLSTFEAFENDDFFSEHILGKVVKLISRPGKSLDDVDI